MIQRPVCLNPLMASNNTVHSLCRPTGVVFSLAWSHFPVWLSSFPFTPASSKGKKSPQTPKSVLLKYIVATRETKSHL